MTFRSQKFSESVRKFKIMRLGFFLVNGVTLFRVVHYGPVRLIQITAILLDSKEGSLFNVSLFALEILLYLRRAVLDDLQKES